MRKTLFAIAHALLVAAMAVYGLFFSVPVTSIGQARACLHDECQVRSTDEMVQLQYVMFVAGYEIGTVHGERAASQMCGKATSWL